jgi:hypothetical protein
MANAIAYNTVAVKRFVVQAHRDGRGQAGKTHKYVYVMRFSTRGLNVKLTLPLFLYSLQLTLYIDI